MNLIKRGKGYVKGEEKDIKDIWRRIRKKDFSGNTGLAVKNSIYQFSTTIVTKIGSLIFMIILARLLMPELFGLYSLALSTILIFGAFSELGLETTLLRFLSKELGKKKAKLKPYLFYLGKIKIYLTILSAALLLILANYLANTFYQKPIFLALLAGILYIVFNQITGFLKSILYASNSFVSIFKREAAFQISRVILIPLIVFLAIRYSLLSELSLMLIILFLAFSLLIASLFLFFDAKKIYLKKIRSEKTSKLSKKQKKSVNAFLIATAVLVLSGVFFGNIDKVMLGRFVASEFIGYYTVAFSLVGALIPLVGFVGVALLPIFSRLKGKRLKKGFRKSLKLIVPISVGIFLVTFTIAHLAVLIIYGREYLLATNILRILSLLLIISPLIGIYSMYFISQGKPQVVSKLLVIATALNIFLNYFLITSLLKYGELTAVYGAAIATLISKGFYLGGLILAKKTFS